MISSIFDYVIITVNFIFSIVNFIFFSFGLFCRFNIFIVISAIKYIFNMMRRIKIWN
jgi:hypothetical protein